MDYLYLHGFASSPRSTKAQFLKQQFARVGQTLHILDLNQNDFAHLTLSRQIEQALMWIGDRPQVTIIGSSFGGLTACWIAERASVQTQIQRLVLLAPAFQFLNQWLPRLGAEAIAQWRETRWLSVYHYGRGEQLPLAYDFITDAQQYDERQLKTAVPTLILHGHHDDVISIQASRDYAAARSWTTLIELDSDHSLGSVQSQIWAAVQTFLKQPNLEVWHSAFGVPSAECRERRT
ncbi:MAG: YqiA/YcfP family alpha/beta fold hydrolase [Cyanobacteria bacterium P01_C01_bin.70]